jgi:hypothetical protein
MNSCTPGRSRPTRASNESIQEQIIYQIIVKCGSILPFNACVMAVPVTPDLVIRNGMTEANGHTTVYMYLFPLAPLQRKRHEGSHKKTGERQEVVDRSSEKGAAPH